MEILPWEKSMGRFTKSVLTFAFVSLLSLGSFASDQPESQVTYVASLDRVYEAETQAFGAPLKSTEKDKCVATYQSNANVYRLLWTATCKDIGNGKVSVTLTAQGQWFFGVGDEKRRVSNVFWNNMDLLLKHAASSRNAPAPAPLVVKPAPSVSSVPPPAPAPSPSHKSQASAPSHVRASPASDGATLVEITSEPSGADILLDGDYAGATPSEIKFTSGPHSVRIVKKGFEPWERSIKVQSGESRSIAADLEKSIQ